MSTYCTTEPFEGCTLLRLVSDDGTNKLSRARVQDLTETLLGLPRQPLMICGNPKFFSVGADLDEINALRGHDALDFAMMGQRLMQTVADFPALTCAVVEGWCMGGGFDLALSCRFRIASPHAVFGHRGAALGLMTGWGGTQRLPRLVGCAQAMEIFLTAEKIHAQRALELGIVDVVSAEPYASATRFITAS
ncbi:Enoyl-CoA hydratase/isomerase [Candidatus Koribacter versatilis Ellin345]|uniref:Enoyl-CoA hydratase/isomerase n=1 Tax=Koribacter versatilis (strain Ellin345) TaxID=204669 RepID=Q1IRR8_KORVE|nr:enoyl-CoA hydratase/isomerase family protein [Candidatus Koribacter versatilis]ABF40432.1 Enoyl-CoA hydratase/isomerase [Candidatus Koribacter versatilis Ellin345]